MSLPNPAELISQMAIRLKAHLKHRAISEPRFIGIRTGGVWVAQALLEELGNESPLGTLDVSFYRDDFAQKGLHADVKPTQISFDVAGATILLVDDVLYTGRTTRAAINELFDYGRPAKIMLAALVDRGERQLPGAADFVAAFTAVPAGQALVLKQADDGKFTLTIDTHHA